METFNSIEDLENCYLIVLRNGKKGIVFEEAENHYKVIVGQDGAILYNDLNHNGDRDKTLDIMSIYGVAYSIENSTKFSTDNRKLLWTRNNIPQSKYYPKGYEKFYYVDIYGDIVVVYENAKRPVNSTTLYFRTKAECEDYASFLDTYKHYTEIYSNSKDYRNAGHKAILYKNNKNIGTMNSLYYTSEPLFAGKKNAMNFIKEVGLERIAKYLYNDWCNDDFILDE